MRIFINSTDQTGSNKTTRLSITSCADTSQFIRQICRQLKINKNSAIISIKSEGINLRIIDGWPLNLYRIKNGSWIILQQNQLMSCNSPISSSTTLQKIDENQQQFELLSQYKNQQKQSMSFSSSHQKSINLQDFNDYFDKQLAKMLNFVRQNKLEQIAQLLKEQPEIKENNQAYRTKILDKKNHYLLNQLGQCGRNALHWAIHGQNIEIVTFLLIKCCDPTIQTIDEYTPLQLAIIHRNFQIATLLINQPKVDVNKLTSHGTALHLASYHHSLNLIKLLLQHGANPEIQNKQNQRPVELTQIKQIKQLFIESQNIKKLRFLKPNIYKGNINLISSVTYRVKSRSLQINPFKNEFLVYKENEIQSKVKLSSVYEVSKIQQKSWLMKNQLHYFKVSYHYQQIESKYLFALNHKQMRNKWIQCINNSIQYVKNSQYVTKIALQDQLVQILDDSKNQIKIHKRQTKQEGFKTPQNKFRYSIFDLKFQQDEIQTPKRQQRKMSQQINFNSHNQNYQLSMITNSQQTSNFRNSEIFLGSIIGQALLTSPIQQRKTISSSEINQKSQHSINQITLQNQSANFRKTLVQPVINEFKLDDKKKISYSDFNFVRQLGSGSFGKVFLAQKKSNKKIYAMKILNKKKLMAKKQLKYAVSETNILKKISHPFIVTLHFSFQTPSNLYIALDYCPNGDLSELLCQKQKLQQSTARFIIAQLILAIEYLHTQKIIYRDLKPENILICDDGYIKLIDFGLSKQNNFAMSFCGSPAYLSPQMLEKKGHGFSTDIYGIGCVLYQMVIGQPPYFDQNIDQLFENIKNARLKFPGYLTKQIKSLISMLLQRDINKRLGVNSINQLKKHEFFKGFTWQKLLKKTMSAPKQIFQQQFEDQYLKLQQAVKSQQVFSDQDYANTSIMLNRIKNFTFCRQEPQQNIEKCNQVK